MEIELVKYGEFAEWYSTVSQHLRLGQAFHQFMKLEKCSDCHGLDALYELDGWEAFKFITKHFVFR